MKPNHAIRGSRVPVNIEVNIAEHPPSDSVIYTAEAFVDGQLYRRIGKQTKLSIMGLSSVESREQKANEIAYMLKDQIMSDIDRGEPWQPNAQVDEYGRLSKDWKDEKIDDDPARFPRNRFKEINLLDKRVEEITSIVSL